MYRANKQSGRTLDKLYDGAETAAEREAAYDRFVWRNLKRNYAGHYVHGMLGLTGFRLVNAPTFVPAYLHMLSGSDVAVGLGLALQQLGGTISPIIGAAHIEHRRHVLPVSMILGSLMRVAVLGIALSGVAAPFYIVYASKAVAMTGNAIGTLSFAYLIADTILNLVWGYMADKLGFRSCFIAALVFWIAATALLMGAHTMLFLALAFFGLGAANSGYQMSAQNIVFEFGRREDMAMRLAVSNTAESIMAALGPLLGGIIAASLGYYAVFAVSIVFEAIALAVLLKFVEEPRKRRAILESERESAIASGQTWTASVGQREAEESGPV